MSSVYITRSLPGDIINKLESKGFDVVVGSTYGIPDRGEVLDALEKKDYEGVITLLSDKVDEEFLSLAPSLKIIANYATGFDNIDLQAAKKRSIVVSNTPGVLDNAVAEHTIALMLGLLRRIPESERFTRDGLYKGWEPDLLLGEELQGKTLGVIGGGKIGYRVSKIAKEGFGMDILYNGISSSEEIDSLGGVFDLSLESVLSKSDVVTLHVPLLDTTRHLINKETLGFMKENSYLINTSRGPVIDESALCDVLISKDIAGVAMDVFENEPLIDKRLLEISNVLLTPHTASATHNARTAMADLACENVISVLSGGEPKTPIF